MASVRITGRLDKRHTGNGADLGWSGPHYQALRANDVTPDSAGL
jgi:hypothetical protein